MTSKNFTYVGMLGASLLVACTPAPKEAYYDRGQPESLLDVSSEVVNVKISSPASVQTVIDTINKEQPTRAEINCQDSDALCREVKNVMHQFKVTTKYTSSRACNVALVYEHILARDCQNRYIDNTPNNANNLNSPTLGCSVSVNMVQMVTDKRQFTDPVIMNAPDANKGIQAVGNYDTVAKPDNTFPPMVANSGSGSVGR